MDFHTFWEIFVIFFETFLFYVFVRTKFHVQNHKIISYCFQFIYLCGNLIIIYICNSAAIPVLFSVFLSLSINVIFIKLFFNAKLFDSLFWSVIYSVICILAEYITLSVLRFVFSSSVNQILIGGKLRIPITCIYISLISFFVFLFGSIFSNKIHLLMSHKIIYTLLSVCGIGISHYIFVLSVHFWRDSQLEPNTNYLIFVNLFFIIMFVLLLIYLYQFGKERERNMQYSKLEKQHELEEQQYRILLNTTESLRMLKHDTKHHLLVIKTLIDQNEIQKLQEYINLYLSEVEKSNLLLASGNTAVDCILSAKLLDARQHGIPINYSLVVPSPFPIDDVSFSALLGNLLDNAIESCVRIAEIDPEFFPCIQFYIKPFKNMVVIHVENPYSETLKQDSKQRYISSKAEGEHGFGLKRIESIVLESKGMLDISSENNVFSVHIMIPMKEGT